MAEKNLKNVTPGIKQGPDIVDMCSCTTCDSFSCFKNRQNSTACSCETCKDSKTCLFYASKKVIPDKSHSAVSNIVQYDAIKPATAVDVEEHEKREPVTNNSDKKIPELSKKEFKIEKSLSFKFDMNSPTTIRSNVVKSRYEEHLKVNGNAEKQVIQIKSTTVKHSDNDMESTRIKLSSELMNVNVNDLKQYLSYNKPLSRSDASYNKKHDDTSSYKNLLSKFEIFSKIKEIYDACSCKVCECLTANRNANCKCKPCDCADCMSYLQSDLKLSNSRTFRNYKRDIDGILTKLNKNQKCQCKPCDCIKCTVYTPPCDCQPCQCTECKMAVHKPKMHLVVAPVGEEHRALCQCSPCECIECVQRFGMPSTVGHEVSTGTNRHLHCQCEMCNNDACESDGTNICPCERRNKIVNKPVQRDTHDYDIRTVLYKS